jgi:hypothetical protein
VAPADRANSDAAPADRAVLKAASSVALRKAATCKVLLQDPLPAKIRTAKVHRRQTVAVNSLRKEQISNKRPLGEIRRARTCFVVLRRRIDQPHARRPGKQKIRCKYYRYSRKKEELPIS